ncbi:MAG: bifunctional methylenetetrahydrofolate dehydrogenase/methenyltetrahydrofolate cyclohydrolase FolD [Ruminococcaceae bacterium]|nr:bifunctional methylenetetrahydrofolate dehydrogenase/methenyltetrahydrofolate cyclohydrolase FolD [Oscillospiraceae bacterium]
MAILMDGKALAAKMRLQIKEKVEALTAAGTEPALAVIIVGNNPASRFYVNNKKKDCAECGIRSIEKAMPEETTEEELLAVIAELNADPSIDGILVQLPVPKHINERRIIEAIDPKKDVDAFHPENVGRVMIGQYSFLPCTPAGVMEILAEYNIDVAGKNCVVIGRSNIVGKPQAMLLLHKNGTVTICHSRTKNLAEITRKAEIIVCAVGKEKFLTADMVSEGAVIIDVGMNVNAEGKLTGDVDFEPVSKLASYITPAPGGVGPMTRVMLLQNTLKAAQIRAAK